MNGATAIPENSMLESVKGTNSNTQIKGKGILCASALCLPIFGHISDHYIWFKMLLRSLRSLICTIINILRHTCFRIRPLKYTQFRFYTGKKMKIAQQVLKIVAGERRLACVCVWRT